jgi:hypothetical protein
MACSKYTLTNTGSTTVNFSYRRCDDSLWEYQVELTPGQTKNIWVINGTYTIAPLYKSMISLINQGAFPPINATATPTATPTTTPTVTPTPSITASQTPTPSVTASQTQTPTQTNTPTSTTTSTPTPTTTTTLTATPTNTETPTNTQTPTDTPQVSPTPTNTPTVTQSGTPNETPTNTPTLTQTPTNTASGTPSVTPTPTPSSFGSNKFKVTMLASARAITNSFTLTESPYIGSSGLGFSATTGTYPLVAGPATVYGTHDALSTSTVTFKINSNGNSSVSIFYFVNGSVVSGLNNSAVTSGSNTKNLFIAGPYLSTDTIEFQIS